MQNRVSKQSFKLPVLTGCWTFVGDVHGRLNTIPKLDHPIIQVGDLGIGFIRADEDEKYLRHRENFWFIRGNHDNPYSCQNHPRYLGDWGRHDFMFWVSGAWSIDQHFRVEGVSWWREEELTAEQMCAAYEAYIEARPRLMISHDAPAQIFEDGPMALGAYKASATTRFLQQLFDAHQPDLWLFGHHHKSKEFTIGKTLFRCLDCSETVDVHLDSEVILLA